MGEICLLSNTHRFGIIALGEVKHVDFSLIDTAFSNYNLLYQAGENAHDGVLVMIRRGISVTRVAYASPNVCIIELGLEQTIRLVTIYALASNTRE